jgi:hypothetical protein
MKILPVLRLTILSGLAGLLCSCASVSVTREEKTDSARPKAKPAHIYVEPFNIEHTAAKEHPLRKHPGRLKQDSQELLANYLVKELTEHVAPASLVKPGAVPRSGGWLVSGEITRLNEGSRMLRMAFGLGMGGTKIETRVAVRNLPLKNAPFLKFDTTGGSGAAPGAATCPIPFSSVPAALLASTVGVTDDAGRTARMISGTIAEYAAAQGWIPARSPHYVKRKK